MIPFFVIYVEFDFEEQKLQDIFWLKELSHSCEFSTFFTTIKFIKPVIFEAMKIKQNQPCWTYKQLK